MKSSIPSPTKADLERFSRFRDLGCVVCRVYRKIPEVPADTHHALNGGRRISHEDTAPLCAWHHRGVIPDGYSAISAAEKFGPSKARNPRAFAERYGDDTELLIVTNCLLEAMKRGRAA
jgi:hypothetical protein